VLDFGALPPEINSGRMYAGPGPGSMLAAAGAWQSLADELTSRTAEEEFEFGLGCLLDGVELRLKQTRSRRDRSRDANSPS